MSLQTSFKYAVFVSLISFVISSAGILSIYRSAVVNTEDQIRFFIKSIANTASSFTDGDKHSKIRPELDSSQSNYTEIKTIYLKLLYTLPDIKYIYTYLYKDNNVYFVIDAGRPNENVEPAQIMEVYEDPTTEMIEAAQKGKDMVETKISEDKWGAFISGYSPIRDSNNNLVAVVGVDVNVNNYMDKFQNLRNSLIISLILCLAGSIMVCYYIYTNTSRKGLDADNC